MKFELSRVVLMRVFVFEEIVFVLWCFFFEFCFNFLDFWLLFFCLFVLIWDLVLNILILVVDIFICLVFIVILVGLMFGFKKFFLILLGGKSWMFLKFLVSFGVDIFCFGFVFLFVGFFGIGFKYVLKFSDGVFGLW